MTCLLTSDQLKKKPPQTSLSCVSLWEIRQGSSFPAVLSSLPPSSSLKNQVLQFTIEMMSCLRKIQLLHRTQSLNLSVFLLQNETKQNTKTTTTKNKQTTKTHHCNLSTLCSSFQFRFSPAWLEAEVGITIAFTSFPSPHVSGQWCFSPSDNTERDLAPAGQGHSSAPQRPDSSIQKHPETAHRLQWALINLLATACGASSQEWLWQSVPRPCSEPQVFKKSIGCLIWPRSPKPSHFRVTGAGDILFALHARQGKAGWNIKSSHKALITPKIS